MGSPRITEEERKPGLVALCLVFLWVEFIILISFPGCSSDKVENVHAGKPISLAGYLKRKPSSQVVFIGMDGASWNIINPMIQRGELPTFKKLKEEGAWCNLRSTDCFISAAAWPAMMTGCNPGRIGVYSFAKLDSFSINLLPADARDVHVPSVWDVASAAGLKVGVVNVPVTYPPRPVNGIMVTGFLTPNIMILPHDHPYYAKLSGASKADVARNVGKISYSPALKGRKHIYRNKITVYMLDTVDDDRPEYDTVCMIIVPKVRTRESHAHKRKIFCPVDSFTS